MDEGISSHSETSSSILFSDTIGSVQNPTRLLSVFSLKIKNSFVCVFSLLRCEYLESKRRRERGGITNEIKEMRIEE